MHMARGCHYDLQPGSPVYYTLWTFVLEKGMAFHLERSGIPLTLHH